MTANINKELERLYQTFYQDSISHIKSGSHHVDTFINAPVDNRRGLSLIVRSDASVRNKIGQLQNALRQIDNSQYYQPLSDLHITALSIISCQENFNVDQINVDEYIDVISTSLKGIDNIRIRTKGVTTTKEAIMIQGYMLNNSLTILRDRLRTNFRKSPLKQDIDIRYLTKTAHITSVRFQDKISDAKEYLEIVKAYREFDFGETNSTDIDLIETDWYCKESKIKLLKRFRLFPLCRA